MAGGIVADMFLDAENPLAEAADVLPTHHDEVGLGLCRCGRVHPCPERQRWIQKRAHYVPLLGGPQ
ncbi:hypothetical protein ACSNOB_24395 [Micromonospora sp. URMC 106]|jgi:hypothetical protein|uniref:hypothetical protein n=1 Tax=Micromonospora sp. URMC 106 TaxID=3423408 RepID=UPI003F1AA43D